MPRLQNPPETGVATLSELIGVAHAIEREAVTRYELLAGEMRRRNQDECAEAFEIMAQEEASHIDDVARWAAGLGESVPEEADFVWRLPSDLARSWDEIAGSSLLTPYRAYAIAVENEERAFAFYAYLAAAADDAAIAGEAEKLAHEELRHAARLRTLRRAAYRAEGQLRPRPDRDVPATEADLERLIGQEEALIASTFAVMAERLDTLGAASVASDLRLMAEEAEARAAMQSAIGTPAKAQPVPESASAILSVAQARLERFSEWLESVLIASDNDRVVSRAHGALEDVIRRIALINDRFQ